MITAVAVFVYIGIAIGLALFLFESDKKQTTRPDLASGLLVGAAWPLLIIAIPVCLILQRFDRTTP